MILVDSSVWIDFFNAKATRETEILKRWIGQKPIVTGDLVLAEVLQGFTTHSRFIIAQQILTRLGTISIVGETIAVQAARNYRSLRARGITIRKTIDTLIATRCIADGLSLLYSDRDFDPFVEHLGLQSAMALPA